MEASQFLKQIKDDGWYLGDTEGACRQYVQRKGPGVITVCVRYTDLLGPETLRSAQVPAGPDTSVPGQGSEPGVVVEKTETGASAYSPDLPGCVATGRDEAEARARLQEALGLHRKALAGEAG